MIDEMLNIIGSAEGVACDRRFWHGWCNYKSSVYSVALRSEKCVAKCSKCVQWVGLFVHGRFHNLRTSEDIFGHA